VIARDLLRKLLVWELRADIDKRLCLIVLDDPNLWAFLRGYPRELSLDDCGRVKDYARHLKRMRTK
jgi:hypothetical protein